MRQASHLVVVSTRGRGLYEFTAEIRRFVADSGVNDGLLTAFCRHTSASLLVQENADPAVRADLERFFARLVPDGDPLFEHVTEGDDDMPAHVRAALTQSSVALPLVRGRLGLGTWQGLYLYEHRRVGQDRQVLLHLIGE